MIDKAIIGGYLVPENVAQSEYDLHLNSITYMQAIELAYEAAEKEGRKDTFDDAIRIYITQQRPEILSEHRG